MPSLTAVAETPTELRSQRQFGFMLMAMAGWVDACAIILFANLFVSFQSGDAIQLGTNIAEGRWDLAAKFFGAQLAFVVGAAYGRYLRMSYLTYGRRIALVCNFILLGLTAIFGKVDTAIPAYAFAAVAMGIQNATMMHEGGILIGTMVTGTLARLGFSISDRLTGEKSDSNVSDNFGQWACFAGGALVGAWGFKYLAANAFWFPAVACLILMPLAAKLPRMQPHPFVRAA